jgi:hypothetical protein
VVPPPPANTTAPSIPGPSSVGVNSTLTTSNGIWSNNPTSFTYQWYSGASPIPSQTTASYLTVSGDIGSTITCQVIAINAGGSSAPEPSNPIVVVPLTLTILQYNSLALGNSFVWGGVVTFNLDTNLSPHSYTAITSSIPATQVPGSANLTHVTIGNSVTTIGAYAFLQCTALTSIIIPDSVTSIGINTFEGCSALTSVTIGNSVTSIGYSAFASCTTLISIIIPNSVTSIDDFAFDSCTALTSVTIGNLVTSIGANAFNSCIALATVTIAANNQLGITSPTNNPPGVQFFGALQNVATVVPTP